MTRHSRTVVFWGAGATKALGIRTTVDQEKFIRAIAATANPAKPLKDRVAEALGKGVRKKWRDALFDLITILGDTDGAYESISEISAEQLEAMRRNWRKGAHKDELRNRIIDLRLTYDWPALKSVVSICPASTTDRFRLNDLFNLLDMHIPPGFGVRAPSNQLVEKFFDARRLIGAKNALLTILIASFYIDYQECIESNLKVLEQYRDSAKALEHRLQSQRSELAAL
jgi:hypothetical protein